MRLRIAAILVLYALTLALAPSVLAPRIAQASDVYTSPDIYEPDNTASTARPLAVDAVPNELHTLLPAGDVDWFEVEASDAARSVDIFGGGADVTCHLYDSSGRELLVQTATERNHGYYLRFEVGGNRTPHGKLRFVISSAGNSQEPRSYGIQFVSRRLVEEESSARVAWYFAYALALAWLLFLGAALAKVIAHRDHPARFWKMTLTVILCIQGAVALLPGVAFLLLFLIGLASGAPLNGGASALYATVFAGYGMCGTLFGVLNILGAVKVSRLGRAPKQNPPASDALPPAV